MANKYQCLKGDIETLSRLMITSKNKDEFRRFQTIWLRIAKEMSVDKIAEITCYSRSWVRQLHSLYKHKGIEGILISPKGGRHNENMTLEEEIKFLEPFF